MRRPINMGTPRMSQKELVLVKYVTRQMIGAYCDARGKPVYARNLDTVMRDIFGVKRFTKLLEKGMRDEGTMINLIRALDLKTIWSICRNSEHYRMLCSLVAIDSALVKLRKKQDEIMTLEPATRPSKKFQRNAKTIKRLQKTYNASVKVFRNIFDIRKQTGSGVDSLLEFAENWRDRNGSYGDDIFGWGYDDFFGSSGGFDSMESMDDYVNQMTKGSGKKRSTPTARPSTGAFGIFDDGEHGDGYDDYFGDEQNEPEPEEEDDISNRDLLVALYKLISGKGTGDAPAPRPEPTHDRYFGEDASSVETDEPVDPNSTAGLMQMMAQGFNAMQASMIQTNRLIGTLVDSLTADDDDPQMEAHEVEMGVIHMGEVRPGPSTAASQDPPREGDRLSMDQIAAMTAAQEQTEAPIAEGEQAPQNP